MSKFTSIDLFAGIGGIRLGFEKAFGNDIQTVYASEWDEHAVKTYKHNFDKDKFDVAGDITKIDENDVPSFNICLAGFPCQAFSLAGQRKGFNDDYKGMSRGTLFFDVARICERHKPEVIFCENVKGLEIHDKGNTYNVIKDTLDKIGYKVFEKVLNSKDFGVPQNRERIYIVAFRKDIAPEKFKFPEPTDTTKRIKDILEKEPVSVKYYLSTTYIDTLRKHKERHAAKGNGFGYEIRSNDGIAGAIVCGGMGRERNLLIDKRLTDFTPVTHIKGEVNREGIRKMTPREWARLQGYPETYQFPVADVHAYKQLGNSVTVNVIEAIAGKIKEVLNANRKQNQSRGVNMAIKGDLIKTGILKSKTKAYEVFTKHISDDFLSIAKIKSSEYVSYCWNLYENYRKQHPQNNSLNGAIFELIIESELYRQGLCPMFLQAKVAFVPNVNFDVLLYSSEHFPIGLSLKTSLRERYKQADLEAIALKYVHRKALNYLITLDVDEARTAKLKSEQGQLLGIDKIVVATNNDLDELVGELAQMKFIQPGKIDIIEAGTIVTKNG